MEALSLMIDLVVQLQKTNKEPVVVFTEVIKLNVGNGRGLEFGRIGGWKMVCWSFLICIIWSLSNFALWLTALMMDAGTCNLEEIY